MQGVTEELGGVTQPTFGFSRDELEGIREPGARGVGRYLASRSPSLTTTCPVM